MFRYVIVIFLAVMLCGPFAPPAWAQTPSHDPTTARAMGLLKANCISCHNAEKHKSGLLLTSREAALKGGDNGPALVPEKSDKSQLIQNLDANAETHMPPKKQLTADEIAVLCRWIDAGAEWDEAALSRPLAATRPVVFHNLPDAYRPVLAIALSADERLLASGRGNRVDIHDVSRPDRPLSRVLEGIRDAVQSLAWSRDGKRLAAGDYGRVLVWELESKGPPVELPGLMGRVTAMQFLPDGNTLVVADGGVASPGRLRLCRVTPAEVGPPVAAHDDEIFALALNADGTLLATGGADKTVKLWDAATLTERAKLEGHTGHVLCAAFNHDGSQLATGAADRDVKVWDVKTHEQATSHGPHPAAVTALAWLASDAKRLAVACEDGTIRFDTLEEPRPGQPLAAANDVIYGIAAQGKGDSRAIYAGCHDGRIYWWDAAGNIKTLASASEATKNQ